MYLTLSAEFKFTVTNNWTEVNYNFTPPGNTVELEHNVPLNNGGKVWFDDVSIE